MKKRRTANCTRQKQINLLQATTRKRHSRQKMMRWLGLGGLVLITLTSAAIGTHYAMDSFIKHAFVENPQYGLKRLVVETGGDYSKREIRRSTGLRKNQNIWSVDLAQVRTRIESLPFVSAAHVEKQLPDTLVIKVKERTPILRIDGIDPVLGTREVLYVDRDECMLFKPRSHEAVYNVPTVNGLVFTELETGQSLKDTPVGIIVDLLKRLEVSHLGTSLNIVAADVSDPFAIEVVTNEKATIKFRTDFLNQQLSRLSDIVEYARVREQRIETVDLTLDRNVPVRFYMR